MVASPKSLTGLVPFFKPYRVGLGFAALFLLLAAGTTLAFPWVLRQLIDQGLSTGAPADQLSGNFLQLFGVAAALAVFSAGRFYMVSWLGERITADLRNAVYGHVLKQSPAFFETTQSGEVLSRLTNDTTLVQTVVGSSFSMGLRNLVMGTGALLMLVWTNPVLMLQVVAVLAAVIFPSVYLGRRVRRLSRANQDRVADSSAIASEVLNAISVVQSYTAEARETRRFIDSTTRALGTALKRIRARSVLVGFIIMASSAVLLWGLYMGTLAVRAGTSTAGQLGETVFYVILLASAFAVLGEVYGDLLRAAGATERLMELLHTESNLKIAADPQNAAWPQGGSSLQIEALRFHYPSRPGTWALDQLSGQIRSGQTVAVVGPSGAGKTTLFDLLMRFHDPQSGRIVLDGVPIDQMDLQDLRERMAIVPQEPVIFSGTVIENIRYGRPDASLQDVHAAAEAAYAQEFIRELPEGFDTYLGDRGVRLSGGQRQRIAIARAILKNPPLLLLDEATSALDAQSEKMVQAALDKAMVGRTTLVIAHRLATVQRADVIWVLERGRLMEQGAHAQLQAKGGLYASLAALQFNAV
ncbi:MAG: ATP-binding cassette domain-containing protein [Limnohabitans sp.]|jgi:ATP-binding cassette subfamily B protein|uniref:ABC transporter transmembrane domain-containing protein n=1 Tax=Limnohabitans sp. TaxID=1907725 RepID=UPI0025E6BD17|nr:ABC transporter transmembrane domain-containing protein [Limnohabitans sp.]MCO4087585.1 ATP-binding cassette domain-containing protein [Limnohabitans sp.]